MKNLKYLFSLALVAIFFASCDTSATMKEIDTIGDIDVAFSSTILKKSLASGENGVFTVEVYRGNASNDAQVPVTLTDASGLFTLASPNVSFTKGSYKSTVTVNYVYTSLTPGKSYSLVFKLDSKSVSAAGQGTLTATVNMKLEYTLLGMGSLVSAFDEVTRDQPVYAAKGLPGYYRLPDCYAAGYPIDFKINSDGTVDVANFGNQATGEVSGTYGMISAKCTPGSALVNKTLTLKLDFNVTAGSYGVFNEVLTMP